MKSEAFGQLGGICGWWLEDLTVGLLGCGSFQELELLRPDCVVVHWQKPWDDEVSKQEQNWLQAQEWNSKVRAAGMDWQVWEEASVCTGTYWFWQAEIAAGRQPSFLSLMRHGT